MIQDRINKINEYFKSIEIIDNISIIKVQFKDKWKAYNSDDEKIKVVKSKDNPNIWLYFGNTNEVTFDEILDLIENTINENLNAAKKISLLNDKFNELKELFATETLERLQTLSFYFNDSPKKRKYTKHKKNSEIENNKEN